MPPTLSKYLSKLSLGLGFSLSLIYPATSQITPNGAGTLVNPQGNQINITGGTQAGANLFHSFQDFNVNSSQVANFLSNPQTQNILGRINGGNPSVINGLLQVTGGSSNLFLMNPAGIIFGQGASLNVPASFTATTANGIGFGNSVFNAFGDNNFSALVGNPDSFLFTSPQAGSIVNAGNLAVGTGQNISLIAGNTINTGNLTAPGGEIQLLAVPGTNRVRLSQPGQVLSLEFVPPRSNEFRAVDLPALLTGSDLPGIVVNPSGQVKVAGTSLPNQQGIAVASGRIDVSSSTGIGGMVQVMGDRVAALNSRINANGATGGGTVRLGGEYLGGMNTGIAPALRFNSQRTLVDRNSLIRANATNTGTGGRVIVWADDTTGFYGRITGRGATERGGFVEVSGKINLDFDGRVELPGANGLFGTLLLDPTNITIVTGAPGTGNGDVSLPNILAATLPFAMTISTGALTALPIATNISLAASSDINVGVPLLFPDCNAGICGTISFTAGGVFNGAGPVIQARGRSLNITATNITVDVVDTGINVAARNGGNVTLNATSGNISSSVIITGSTSGISGAINLTATGNISNTSTLVSGSTSGTGGAITFNAGGSITLAGTIDSRNFTTGNSGAISLTAGSNITTPVLVSLSNNGNSGSISLSAGNNITTGVLVADSGSGNGGTVNLTSQGGITTSDIITNSTTGSGGAITLNAPQGSITTGAITSVSGTGPGNGGAVNFTSQGNISTGDITSAANSGNSGAISLTSQGNISTGNIASYSNNGGSGSITFTSQGNISSASIFSYGTGGGNTSGNINVNAANFVRVTNSATCNGLASSICSAGQGGAGNGAITIRHGGGIATPFTIGNASINGTAAAINAGTGANTIPATTLVPVPPAINNYGTNISIITNAPEPPPEVPLDLLLLLINPRPPVTPEAVVVGTPPEPEPIAEIPIAPPPIAEIPVPLPSPSPVPTPSPIPTPIPIPIPIPTPTPNLISPIDLTRVNTNPQLPQLTSEPFSGNITLITNPTIPEISPRLRGLEESFQSEFQQYLGITSQVNPPQTLQETQFILNQITETTGVKPGLMYLFFAPPGGSGNFSSIELASQTNRTARDTDILEAVVITGTGEPVRVRLPGTTRRQVLEVANNFRSEVTNFRSSRGFLNPAQQMYKWILEPLEEELQKQGINNLIFLMDSGLRSIPLAAMHDGKGFIVERYSVGLMPSLNLTPLDHVPLEGAQVLAMGANTFGDSGLNPLPAVPLELNTISQLWEGAEFLNETFTLNNLIQQRQNRPFRMIHLATHGVFNPGDRSNSYIQLWDGRLRLDQLDQLNWGNPPVDLLVLSACQTALGDKDAELGFAGLAINAGVRSALASLWEVNDAATLGLMTKFYQQLQVTSTKSEALRLAQLAMIRGEVRLENGNLVTANGSLPLSEEVRSLSNLNLTHPYYWSAFTMIGNPW